MRDRRLIELDHQIAEADARARRLGQLIERQRQLGTLTNETEALVAEVGELLASMRWQRRQIASA